MRICFVATEIMAHGDFGGFGALTRQLASGLSDRGHEVYVVVPNREGHSPFEEIEGFKLVAHPTGIRNYFRSKLIYELVDADIYHSEEPSVGTYMAMKAMPNRKHLITFQDPRYLSDRHYEWDKMGKSGMERIRLNVMARGLYYYSKRAVKKADRLAVQAWYAEEKARDIYNVSDSRTVSFLPNPVYMPERRLEKADTPTACFLGRFNQRKRLELFCDLATFFPEMDFIVMGKPESDNHEYGESIMRRYEDQPNIEFTGFVSEKRKSQILERSWMLINTSWRECLPVSYLEAVAHKCAIVSHENPDDFPVNFGYHTNGTLDNGTLDDYLKILLLDDYRKGIKILLKDERWRERGEKAYEYVKEHHEHDKVIKQHEEVYREMTENEQR